MAGQAGFFDGEERLKGKRCVCLRLSHHRCGLTAQFRPRRPMFSGFQRPRGQFGERAVGPVVDEPNAQMVQRHARRTARALVSRQLPTFRWLWLGVYKIAQ